MNINEALLRNKHEVFIYELKPETISSYYQIQGSENILPSRIGFSKIDFIEIKNKGRALIENKVGQIVGNFKVKEDSQYKQHKPYAIFSSVWAIKEYPLFTGYGDIGISNEVGRIKSSKDLFIVYRPSKDIIQIHLFKGLVEFKDCVIAYLEGFILKKHKP